MQWRCGLCGQSWLEQTRLFLSAQGLQTSNMETWEAFSTRSAAPYDIVFYDLGKGRREFLPAALSFRNRSGLFVLDDFQILRYRKAVRRSLRGKPYALFSLSSYTRDRYLRYSALVTDLKSTT
jgi:predicted O-methyltransferase YrrM